MRRYIATGIILVSLLTGAVLLLRSQTSSVPGVDETLKIKGPAGAPVEIIEYSNFECHSCRDVQPVIKSLMKKYPKKIRLVFRHYPAYGDQKSLWSHVAAECAAQKGKFWAYHDLLFEYQKVWSVGTEPFKYFVEFAKQIGLNPSEFEKCLTNPEILKRVKEEDASGMKLGFRTTPSFLINGQAVVGSTQFEQKAEKIILKELIKKEGMSS